MELQNIVEGAKEVRVEGRIAAYITKMGIMQSHVARMADIEQSKFNRAMNGNASLTGDEVEAICTVLEKEPNFFLKPSFMNEKVD